VTALGAGTPHLPRQAPIDAYGNGGFRFAGMSHKGSLLCLPDGIWAWPIADMAAFDALALSPVFARLAALDFFLLGTGRDPRPLPQPLRTEFRSANVSADAMATGAAVRTYNILVAENRRVAAALIAVD